jgi:hypothetical protein
MAKTVKVRPAKKDEIQKSKGIIHYDKDNLYPNTMNNIIDRSPTAKACLGVMERFVFGRGMTESGDFWKQKVNIKGLRVDQLVRRIIKSYKRHGGFALHFNYNSLYQKCSVKPLEFASVRIGKPDDEDYSGKVIVYPKWAIDQKFDRVKDVYDVYNPDPEIIQRQVELAGGWEHYNGQVWYFGENGEYEYPLSPFEACRNDMISEIFIGAGKNSNVSSNFLGSQILVLPGTYGELSPYPGDRELYDRGEETNYEKEIMQMLSGLQGAERMGSIAVIENNIRDKDNNPVKFDVIKFDIQNFDKIHEYTEKSCEDTIIKTSGVPHILLKPTATGFSQELLDNYYQFYNEATNYDRQIIEESMMETFKGWFYDINPSGNYEIKKLTLTIDQQQTNTNPKN